MTEQTAGEITVRETLALLETNRSGLSAAVANGEYVFWLGSGISRSRLDGLPALVGRVLRYLQAAADEGGRGSAPGRAFAAAIGLADLSEADQASVDFAAPIDDWPTFGVIVRNLSGKYSALLDIPVAGQEPDFLVWDVLDVSNVYGDNRVEPDVEHYCMAALILEGAAPEIVSANWDGLIEKALSELVGTASAVGVRVRTEDFRATHGLARLLKFHGCAVRAHNDPATYRRYLIARRSQITDWPHDGDHHLMRTEMSSLAATRRTLMIGLSAQDTNIQDLFSLARNLLTWNWDAAPPAFVFAEDVIGGDQQNILQVVYGADYRRHQDEIDRAALLRAYAKPLLVALLISVLSRKLEALARFAGRTTKDDAFLADIRMGIAPMAQLVADAFGAITAEAVRRFLLDLGGLLSMFREGVRPAEDHPYMPLGDHPVDRIASDPNLAVGGSAELALAIAAVGAEQAVGTWHVGLGRVTEESGSVLRLSAGGSTSHLYFAANEAVAIRLELNGIADLDDPTCVIVHSAPLAPRQQRSPVVSRGRTGQPRSRQIDVAQLVADATSLQDVRRGFREQISL